MRFAIVSRSRTKLPDEAKSHGGGPGWAAAGPPSDTAPRRRGLRCLTIWRSGPGVVKVDRIEPDHHQRRARQRHTATWPPMPRPIESVPPPSRPPPAPMRRANSGHGRRTASPEPRCSSTLGPTMVLLPPSHPLRYGRLLSSIQGTIMSRVPPPHPPTLSETPFPKGSPRSRLDPPRCPTILQHPPTGLNIRDRASPNRHLTRVPADVLDPNAIVSPPLAPSPKSLISPRRLSRRTPEKALRTIQPPHLCSHP